MDEKTILRISLILTIVGIGILYFLVQDIRPQAVAEYDALPLEEKVQLQGVVQKVSGTEKVTFLQVAAEKKETVDVVVFSEEPLFLQEGDVVEIDGQVEEYKGKTEIIASKVTVK